MMVYYSSHAAALKSWKTMLRHWRYWHKRRKTVLKWLDVGFERKRLLISLHYYGQGTCLNRQIQRPMQVSSSLVKVSNCSPAGCRWIPIHTLRHCMACYEQIKQASEPLTGTARHSSPDHLTQSRPPPTLPPNLEQVAPNKDVGELRRRPNHATEDHKTFSWLGAEEREVAHLHAALHHTLPRLLQQHPGHRLGFRKPIHLNKKHKGGSGKSQKFKMFKENPHGMALPLPYRCKSIWQSTSSLWQLRGTEAMEGVARSSVCWKSRLRMKGWLITIWIPTSQQPPTSSCQQLWI